jgi:Mrp family chromosome partitioning ATPase
VALTGDIPTVARLGSPVRNAVLAGLLGVVLGTLLAVYRDRTDPIVRGAGQLAGSGLRYRGTITADDDPPAVPDAFRRLAVGCVVTEERHVGRILVVGVDEGCDALFIAAGLVAGLAACGRRVTLVDAVSGESLRQSGGFSDVVDGSYSWSECQVRNGSDHSWQMDIGTKGDSVDALLINGTDTKRRLPVSGAQEHIIIAAPSITHTSLAVALTAVADGALVVVKERSSHVSDVLEAKRTLDAMEIPVIGMVLVSGTAGEEQIKQVRDHRVDFTSSPNGEVRSSTAAGKA